MDDLLALAGRLSPTQLSRMARRARRKSAQEADRLHRRRRVNARRDEQSGGVWLDGVLFDDDAATFTAAVDAYLAATGTNPATGHYDPLEVRVADAVLDMARAYLGAKGGDPRPTVVVHADARILLGEDGWAETTGWTALSAETVRRLACFCKLGMIADGPDGAPIGVGRARRIAPPWVAENVRHRDGGCRMCGRPLFTQIHHIIPWDAGGRTDINALCELCYEHHHLVHEGGWRIEGNPDGELRFISPTGRTITSYPACPPTTTPPPTHPTTPQPTTPAGAATGARTKTGARSRTGSATQVRTRTGSDTPSLLDEPGRHHPTRPASPAATAAAPAVATLLDPPPGHKPAAPAPPVRSRRHTPSPTATPPHAHAPEREVANPTDGAAGDQPDRLTRPTPPPQPERPTATPAHTPPHHPSGRRRPTKIPGGAPPGPTPDKPDHHTLNSEPTLFGDPTVPDDT